MSVGKYSTRTDSHGHFELRFLDDGGEVATVTAAEYRTKTQPLTVAENDITLEPEFRSVLYLVLQFLKEIFG